MLGCRYIETDVQITADGVVVVFHDDRLERVTNGTGWIRDWRYEDLLGLDAAYNFDAAGGFPLRGTGVAIPSLADVLHRYPDLRFNIELKAPNMERQVAQIIKRQRRERTTLVASFSDRRLMRFRRVSAGSVATSAGRVVATLMWFMSRIGRSFSHAAIVYQLPFDYRVLTFDRQLVKCIHAAGAQVHAWTVNDAADMHRLLDIGTDGIVTDRPDILNEVLAARAS